jgi:hypothetical protein
VIKSSGVDVNLLKRLGGLRNAPRAVNISI